MEYRDAMVPEDAPVAPSEPPASVPTTPVESDLSQILKAMFLGKDPRAKLQVVETAIFELMFGSQSYQIGSRKITRADMKQLIALRSVIQSEIAATNGNIVSVGIARRY